jgi:M6 family metalloprotease-like protein
VGPEISTRVETIAEPEPAPPTGTPRNVLLILWNPHRSDVSVPGVDAIRELVFGAPPSVRDYYAVQSGGRVDLTSAGVLGWFDAKHPSDYDSHDLAEAVADSNDAEDQRCAESILDVDEQIDFASFDLDRDGVLRPDELGICVVIAQEEPFSAVRRTHGGGPNGEPLIVDHVFIPIVGEVSCGAKPNFGAFAHEIARLVFDLSDIGSSHPRAREYSLMDASSTDAALDPYSKLKMGWLEQTRANSSIVHALHDAQSTRDAVLLGDPEDELGPTYLLEYRRRGVYDRAIPAEGLAIWRIDSTVDDYEEYGIELSRAPAPDDLSCSDPSAPRKFEIRDFDGRLRFVVRFTAPSADYLALDVELVPLQWGK